MFCPKCKAEYNDGSKICAGCDEILIDSLRDNKSRDNLNNHENVELIEILTTTDQGEIALIKSVLESEKIPHYVHGEHLTTLPGPLPVRLMVPENKAEEAKLILKNFL